MSDEQPSEDIPTIPPQQPPLSPPLAKTDDLASQFNINFGLPLDRKLGSLLESEILTDVEFLVGESGTVVRAHKLVLAVGSPVFLRQFFGTLPSESSVRLPDIDLDAFRVLLQYVYGIGGVALLGDGYSEGLETKTLSILYAAHKYDVRGLQELCALKLSLSLNSWNVLSILHTAEMYSLGELGSKCWKVIQENTRSVLNFHQHSVDYATLLRIVKDESLSIDEVKLFEFLNIWAENECEREEILPSVDNKLRRLGDLLRHIRFPTMNSTDFANRVAPKGLLSEEEVARVLTYICSSPGNRVFLKVEFPINRRREQEAILFQSTSSHGPHACSFLNPLAALLLPAASCGGSGSRQHHQQQHGLLGDYCNGGPNTWLMPSLSAGPSHSQQHFHHGGTLFQGPGCSNTDPSAVFTTPYNQSQQQQVQLQPLHRVERGAQSPSRSPQPQHHQHNRFSSRRGPNRLR